MLTTAKSFSGKIMDNTQFLTDDLLDPNAQNRQKAELATDKIRRKFGVNAIIKGRSLR